jgi:hypothetical protein
MIEEDLMKPVRLTEQRNGSQCEGTELVNG